MEKIKSFKLNHKTLLPGIYVSREDGKTTTYDIRLVKPNNYPILSTSILHTIEHLAATYMRNSKYKNHIIYFGPMVVGLDAISFRMNGCCLQRQSN